MPVNVEESFVAQSKDSAVRSAVTVVREPWLAERVLFIGGLSGCGKTAVTAALGGFARVEIQKFNYVIEHVCNLRWLGRIEADVATVMIRMLTDLDLYHLAMSREVNLRFSDLSSIFRNPGTWRYLRRLVQPGDAAAVERIRNERLIPHFMMHNLLVNSSPLFEALGARARVVEIVRHPLHMLKAWRSYIERYGTDARDFNVWFDYQGHALPFFARGWEELYLRSNPMDRAILAIDHLVQLGQRVLEHCSDHHRTQLVIIPFERFVLEPWPYLRQLEGLLGTRATKQTYRELRRQRIPRTRLADGVTRSIYRQYGWEPAQRQMNERQELDTRRAFAAQYASSEGMAALDRLSADYETKYWHP